MTHPTPSLSERAEQALVVALLRDPTWFEGYRRVLTPDRFTNPTYAAIVNGLAEQVTQTGAGREADFSSRLAERLNLPGVDAAYLRDLAATGPDAADLGVYARMVQEAFVRRQLAAQAERIAASAGPVRGVDDHLDHLDRLAKAVARLAPADAEVRASAAGAVAVEVAAAPIVGSRQWREDQVLADLLQNGEQVVEVEVWLTADTFEDGPRREVYEAIVTVSDQGEPVTELTVAWELSRQYSADGTTYDATMEGYLASLLATEVVVGTAVEIGRDLLVDTLRADLAVDAARVIADVKQGEQVGPVTGTAAEGPRARAAEQTLQEQPMPTAVQAPPAQPTVEAQPKIRP
ncbi:MULTISPECIES: DnaB-like helicase N-terminal domain-containing protein [Streptacidiphilus]|uniref:DnaB-like helicase N-terminal domain-containing protein n=1 Tax=Streptacidiphilus cavernicola TaxID=3342716 RepID=A0ABV6V0C2_9ACTN|nr:DnaB-like helicase N-terminal domain-containing protein [Streptacidiphilus jeojiense]